MEEEGKNETCSRMMKPLLAWREVADAFSVLASDKSQRTNKYYLQTGRRIWECNMGAGAHRSQATREEPGVERPYSFRHCTCSLRAEGEPSSQGTVAVGGGGGAPQRPRHFQS